MKSPEISRAETFSLVPVSCGFVDRIFSGSVLVVLSGKFADEHGRGVSPKVREGSVLATNKMRPHLWPGWYPVMDESSLAPTPKL